jgi:serine O-acetyltransferase
VPTDDIGETWKDLKEEARLVAEQEPVLTSYLHATVLKHTQLGDALAYHLAGKLACHSLDPILLREVMDEALEEKPDIVAAACADLRAVRYRDPASRGYLEPFLHFKGFHALQSYRIAHWLWESGRQSLACHLQSRISEVFGVDIHPAAVIGRGILVDHATAVVIKQTGDRHPKVRRGVLIGAGAKILGNVEIGEGAKVAAGSVVLEDVPAHSTVAGVPAQVVGRPSVDQPALEMDQRLQDPDEAGPSD